MTSKIVLAVLAAGTMTAGSMNGLGTTVLKSESVPASSEAEGSEEKVVIEPSVSIETSEYYFGKINVPYADFYYGEINKVLPENLENASAGQYDAEDKVTAAGFREEGIYDAVTSATNAKSQKFEKTYFEQTEDGTNIIGVTDVNVAIAKSLYDDVKKAIENETECSNPLVEFVAALEEVSNEEPVEYKVINSDGTLSQTIGSVIMENDVEVSFTTVSTWGTYQIDFDGLEIEAADVQGALVETSDGTIYGLEHLDNLWLRANEIAFAAEEMTEPHGNTPSYARFVDIQGKTITKVTYMLADKDDIAIETKLYCKALMGEDYSIELDKSVVYQSAGTNVNITYNTPDDSDYTVDAVAAGRSAVAAELYSVDENVITLGNELKPGSYSVTFSDETYASCKVSFMVESGLNEEDVAIENNAIVVADNDKGLTAADYAAAVSKVAVNGEALSAKGIASIILNEDGSINLEAEIDNNGETQKIFDESESYEIEFTATGYPSVSGTVRAQ